MELLDMERTSRAGAKNGEEIVSRAVGQFYKKQFLSDRNCFETRKVGCILRCSHYIP